IVQVCAGSFVREAAMRSAGRSWLLLTGFVVFYIIYLLFGGLVFSTIERPEEERLRHELDTLKQEFLNHSCASAADLDHFLARVLQAHRSGVSVLQNSSQPSNWDLTSSMFYANTLVTTVGYGHSTPLSDLGKGFSILYALLGVPFTMLVLTACVQKLLFPLVVGPVAVLHGWGVAPRAACALHLLLLLLLLLLCFFIGPAALFSWLEGSWSFLDGVYFCFISLCTIGLGDYVPALQPGQRNKSLYQVGHVTSPGLAALCEIQHNNHSSSSDSEPGLSQDPEPGPTNRSQAELRGVSVNYRPGRCSSQTSSALFPVQIDQDQ
uniref:Potassium channel domain-containing protein n=1 Tax=Periophthalmus magnuspinnatus TaxID=409849 RepID=A0A3B3ZEL8_9GOBI